MFKISSRVARLTAFPARVAGAWRRESAIYDSMMANRQAKYPDGPQQHAMAMQEASVQHEKYLQEMLLTHERDEALLPQPQLTLVGGGVA